MKYKKWAVVLTLLILASVGTIALLTHDFANASERSQPPEVGLPMEQLAILNQKATALTNQPGWLFFRTTVVYDTDSKNNGILPDGQEIPLSQVLEVWFHLNDEGLVFEFVNTMLTLDGEVIQESVFLNGVVWSSATNEEYIQSAFFLTPLDGGFSSLADDYITRTGKMPDMSVTEQDGRKMVVFTIEEMYEQELTLSDFDQPVIGSKHSVSLDEETGFITQEEVVYYFSDGIIRSFYTAQTVIQVDAVPPEEIVVTLEARR